MTSKADIPAHRRPSLRVAAIFAEKISMAPKACDIDDPHHCTEPGGCDHATWSITWGYGGVFVQELKLCEKHKNDLFVQLDEGKTVDKPKVTTPSDGHVFEPYNVPSKPYLSDSCTHCGWHRETHQQEKL